jgi:hypothetical protein
LKLFIGITSMGVSRRQLLIAGGTLGGLGAASLLHKVFSKNNAPGNTSKPQITGSSYLFGTLSGSLGSWTAPSGTNSYARQWKRATDNNGVPGTYSSISGN